MLIFQMISETCSKGLELFETAHLILQFKIPLWKHIVYMVQRKLYTVEITAFSN